MNFEEYLKENAKAINKELDLILSGFVSEAKKTNVKLTPFALELKNSSKGGKRIRGVLCKLGYEFAKTHLPGVKARPEGEILKIGTALEILHTALLIHDDIMDKSPIRRNNPSLYKALGGNHKAISQAISLGDIGFYLPVKLISGSAFADEVKIKALSFLSEVIINTGWGQILDVELTQSDHTSGESKPTQEVIKFINLFKTAKYTIAGPLQIGAILAGADKKLINLLGQFGENLGIAFQIKDDILDGTVNGLASEQELALKYVFEAKKIIPKITSDPKMKKLLEDMGEYLIQRTK